MRSGASSALQDLIALQRLWASGRYTWVDEARVPVLPDWTLQEKAESEADLIELSYIETARPEAARYFQSSGQQVEEQVVEVDLGPVEEDLFSQEARLLLLAPRQRRENLELQGLLTDQGKSVEKKKDKEVKQKKCRVLTKVFLQSWRDKMRKKLASSSRAQLLSQLVPRSKRQRKNLKKCLSKKAMLCWI